MGESVIPVLIYDAVAEPAKLECPRFEIIRPSEELNPTVGIIRIKNAGGRLAKLRGRMALKKDNGEEYAYMDIGLTRPEMIMPAKEREFRFDIPNLDAGNFTLSAEMALEGRRDQVLYEERSFVTTTKYPKDYDSVPQGNAYPSKYVSFGMDDCQEYANLLLDFFNTYWF